MLLAIVSKMAKEGILNNYQRGKIGSNFESNRVIKGLNN
jgi:hypothetical protein